MSRRRDDVSELQQKNVEADKHNEKNCLTFAVSISFALSLYSLHFFSLTKYLLQLSAVIRVRVRVWVCDMQATWPQLAIHRCSFAHCRLVRTLLSYIVCWNVRCVSHSVQQMCYERRTNSCQRNCLPDRSHKVHKAVLEYILFFVVFFSFSACSYLLKMRAECRHLLFHIFLLRILLLHTTRSTTIVFSLLYSQLNWCGRLGYLFLSLVVFLPDQKFHFFFVVVCPHFSHGMIIIVQKRADAVAVVIIIVIVVA